MRNAVVGSGKSRKLHDLLARQLDALEQNRASDEGLDDVVEPDTSCAPGEEA
jgi:hypothetical protein